jgi:hypothetical protein
MLAGDLIAIIREDDLDDVTDPCAEEGGDAAYAWSDAALLRHLAEAQQQACWRRDLRVIRDESTAEVCELALSADVSTYLLDPRVLRIERARVGAWSSSSADLVHATTAQLECRDARWRQQPAGTPTQFVVAGRSLVLHPRPGDALDGEMLRLAVWREPLLSALAADDELELPGDQRALGHWVCYRAYSRRDEETYNPKAATEHLALFERAFGPPVQARVREELLRVPDGIALTPVPGYCGPVGRIGRSIEEW